MGYWHILARAGGQVAGRPGAYHALIRGGLSKNGLSYKRKAARHKGRAARTSKGY